ncbi:Uu.00g120210.m01.CDS01 [Anthostomella pinea]|uniref:Uu.00g120210.m01.CDS01 n=1 Tax=Anthostomella pinea TaxID=933095 RepID=A0AAI8VBI5_9PEZI|nr:Uu.00g120210.m01.CDS01 [Anthostomella pinea]
MAPKGKPYDTDWIWSSYSNVHIANHRDWFTPFTPFSSTITSTSDHGNETHIVEGRGDVSLEVRRMVGPAAKAAKNKAMVNSTIVLKDVLFVPTFGCNVLGEPVRREYDVSIGVGKLLMDKSTGRGVGLLERNEAGLTKVILKGQAKGQSSFEGGEGGDICVTWDGGGEEEKRSMESKT